MEIVLISPIFSDLGISTIAPLLKKEGHKVRLLFIPQFLEEPSRLPSKRIVRNIKKFVSGAELIGINSFSENHRPIAVLVSEIKKSLSIPVVWGGIHASLMPEDCIKYADIVCVGEGEQAIVELARRLARKEEVTGVKSLLFRSEWSGNSETELYPPVDLNLLPPLDYDVETQYILDKEDIRGVEESDFRGAFYSFSSRGCPFRCSYCCNATVHGMYNKHRVWRQRHLDKAIDDLLAIKRRFLSCRSVWFNEADFLSGKTREEIEDFSKQYKAKIGIPFSIWSNPFAINEDCIRALKEAGLRAINIGTINGSDKIQHSVYNRNAFAELYAQKAQILKKYEIKTEYDFILCNPYEREDDVINSIKLLMRLPKPFSLVIYTLTYFPKTKLYEMAMRDGKIKIGQKVQSYTKATYRVWILHNNNWYLNIVASTMRGRARRSALFGTNFYGLLPEPLLNLLINKEVINMFGRLPFRHFIGLVIGAIIISFYRTARKAARLGKKIRRTFT